jgi:hypothetical protein
LAVITVYRGAKRPEPAGAMDRPWPELALEIEALANEPTGAPESASDAEQKRRMIAWAPHALRVPHRLAENVSHVSLLVVDVDEGGRPEEAAARMQALGIEGLIYESPRSTPALPKFRVVATISEPIPPDACRETRTRFAEMLGLPPDCGVHQAIEAAKLFFAGRLHGTPPRRVWFTEGAPVDPRELPPNSEAWAKSFTSAPALSPHLEMLPPADCGIVAAIGDWRKHAGRKWDLCGKIGGLMRWEGYSSVQCESVIREWLDETPADVDVDAGVTWALGAWGAEIGVVSSAEESAARLLGPEHARVLANAIAKGAWPERVFAARPKDRASNGITAGADLGDPLGTRHLLSETIAPIPYAIPGLCIAPNLGGKVSMIGGLPGAGKGPIEAYICVCVALGVPLFGVWNVVRQKVLYVDVEGWRLTARRMQRMAIALGHDQRELDDWLDLWDVCTLLDDRTHYRLEAHEARFIALDSYTTAMMRYDLDQNKNEFARGAQALATLPDRVVLPITHARKPTGKERHEAPDLSDISGSGALGALAQTGISVWKPDPTNPLRVSVACLRAPEAQFAPFDVEFRDLPNGGLALVRITAEERAQQEAQEAIVSTIGIEAVTNALLDFLHRYAVPHTMQTLCDAVVVGLEHPTRKQIGVAIDLLDHAGLVKRHLGTTPKIEICGVQTTPVAVSVSLDGRVTFAPGAFRRPGP